MREHRTLRLFLAGLAALFWELVLIRWLGSNIRIVAYYTNFVLIAAFFGLGVGALLAAHPVRLVRLLFPTLGVCLLSGLVLGGYVHLNPSDPAEFIWLGKPRGVTDAPEIQTQAILPLTLLLGAVYLLTAAVFAIFGQCIGALFRGLPPLKAYTVEILGSISGILLFAALAHWQLPPLAWIALGFGATVFLLDRRALDVGVAFAVSAVVLLAVAPVSRHFIWSPYYKIRLEPMSTVFDLEARRLVSFPKPVGYELTVNNDYHQMILDLHPDGSAHPFLESWRALYDAPYAADARLPPGPVLVVGAGTGNDVTAALRRTRREVYAVDIDPAIVALGARYHFEQPYQSPRVTVVIDDARSFFHQTDRRFALVVFGFLDSHTLLSSFSSLRLDNFVYTREAFQQVKKILLPGGRVVVTFSSNRQWIHQRLIALLAEVFDAPTEVSAPRSPSYANGIIYTNVKAPAPGSDGARPPPETRLRVPTDDWPFLYLATPQIPLHYRPFLVGVVCLGFAPLLLLPAGERRIRLPYFFLGAAFFLLETSNVVSLSLLYGSTWVVNVVVFTGILTLVLLGNLTSYALPRLPLRVIFVGLTLSVALAYLTPTSALLRLEPDALRALVAVIVFLGPVYFASVIFAILIRAETSFYEAYGSNILGAVVGGALEYSSLLFGFKFLLGVTMLLYLVVFLLIERERLAPAPALTA